MMMPEDQDITKIIPRRIIHLFAKYPRKFHYRIRVVVAGHRESVDLVYLAEVVDKLMERAPGRMMSRVLSGEMGDKEAMAHFRELRDSIHKLKGDVEAIADAVGLAGILAQKRSVGTKRKTERPGAAPAAPKARPDGENKNNKISTVENEGGDEEKEEKDQAAA